MCFPASGALATKNMGYFSIHSCMSSEMES
jgi:hypothetical protein